MKISGKQIIASAFGAVLAAALASFFGEKGTIIGVAIGSVIATTGASLAFQSVERAHSAVKAVVIGDAEGPSLLRHFGETRSSGEVTHEPEMSSPAPVEGSAKPNAVAGDAQVSAPDEATKLISAYRDKRHEDPTIVFSPEPLPDPTEKLPKVPVTRQPAPVVAIAEPKGFILRWPTLVGAIVAVFVVALLFVTAVELVAGRPLSSLFGGRGTGTSVAGIVDSPPTTVPVTTTTSAPTTTTTTTTTTPTTTSTTLNGSPITTLTIPGDTTSTSSTTTTTTTTTVP